MITNYGPCAVCGELMLWEQRLARVIEIKKGIEVSVRLIHERHLKIEKEGDMNERNENVATKEPSKPRCPACQGTGLVTTQSITRTSADMLQVVCGDCKGLGR